MSDWLIVFCLTFAAGLAMVVGGLLAAIEHISNRWLETELRHTVIAFGGGILVSAIALVLVHEGMRNLHAFFVVFSFGLGGLVFMGLDRFLHRRKEQVPQLAAMLLDFIPEVVALGAVYLLDKPYALLLGFLIVIQNIPEGFNAYLELRAASRQKGRVIIGIFLLMSLLGPIAGLSGYFFLSDYPSIISGIMLFAAGGILYLVFQDIAPQAQLKRHWAPSFGAVLGFMLGLIGKILI